jgi:hypothetical protein
MTQVVILGWDALDETLLRSFGLSESFGHAERIGTYINPIIDHPHTKELWPSMISGQHPDEHGIHAVSDTEGVEWDNPVIDTAATLATGIVPHSVRTVIGRQLRERGAGLDQKRVSYYETNGVPTVFEGVRGRPISIPNYRTAFDAEHGLDGNRDDVWGAILPDRDGTEGLEPSVSYPGVMDVLGSEAGRRLGHTLAAMEGGFDLVWTWFGLLDTAGHIDPAMGAPLQRQCYQMAAGMTETVREAAGDETIVVSVSDHGLMDGDHTDYATLATGAEGVHDDIGHVFDIADWIRRTVTTSASAQRTGYEPEATEEMTEQLEDLGYL